VDEFLDGTNLLIDRGVTRIDGVQGKKHLRSFGSKYTVLKKVLVTLL